MMYNFKSIIFCSLIEVIKQCAAVTQFPTTFTTGQNKNQKVKF